MRTYYKITCTREHEMAGAGLGYDEIFGDAVRYHWRREEAEVVAAKLNNEFLRGGYGVEERKVYDDGPWDDEGDRYAAEQLGLGRESGVS